MDFNWKQIYDFWGFGIESLICFYIFRGKKQHLTFEIIKSIDYLNVMMSSINIFLFCCLTITFMMGFYMITPRLFILFNAGLTLMICVFVIENKLLAVFIFTFLMFNCFKYAFLTTSELKKALIQSFGFFNIIKKTLPFFFLFGVARTMFSMMLFRVLVTLSFTGHKFYLFIFMNYIFMLAVSKKIMTEVVLLFIHKNNNVGIFSLVISRILSIGTITLSSLLRPIFLILQTGQIEELAMVYACINKKTYFSSFETVKQLESNGHITLSPVYVKNIFYPFVFCVISLSQKYIKNHSFYDDYTFCNMIFCIHASIIEVIYTLQAIVQFVIVISPDKEMVSLKQAEKV